MSARGNPMLSMPCMAASRSAPNAKAEESLNLADPGAEGADGAGEGVVGACDVVEGAGAGAAGAAGVAAGAGAGVDGALLVEDDAAVAGAAFGCCF